MSDGVRLHHRLEGEGPPLVLLHPIGLDLTSWDGVATHLRERFRVVRVDLRGHGRSPVRPLAESLSEHALDVHRLLGELALAPAAVVGVSFGGMIAQTLALDHPGDVRALVIAACACTFSEEARAVLRRRGEAAIAGGMAAVVEETLERWFTEPFRASEAVLPYRRRLLDDDVPSWAAGWRAIAAVDTAPRLAGIRVPNLVLAGGADRATPVEACAAIAERIPGARLEVLADAPHMAQIEQPAAFASAVRGLLNRVRWAGAPGP